MEEKGYDFEVVKYLEEGINETELSEIIAKSEKTPFDFVRQHEKDYKDMYKGKVLSDKEWIKVLVENPKLLHRPIIVNGNKAVLGNPPENIDGVI